MCSLTSAFSFKAFSQKGKTEAVNSQIFMKIASTLAGIFIFFSVKTIPALTSK